MEKATEFTFSFDSAMDLKKFLQDVGECENEVYFETTEGDRLALRSALSRFILYSICSQPHLSQGTIIRGFGEHDRQILNPYIKR